MAGRDGEHPRLILPNFLSLKECEELEFIHKSCSAVGYRPNVFSTTLSHLIATNSAHLIIPFLPIRERLKEKLEEFFGCEYELCVEFTGLISWCRGASIGWHSDDNRPYLKQRDFVAVCYLNNYGEDFKGGLFHFQDGEPATVTPLAGDVIMYTADSRNIHCVDEITDGERLTLTLWFSRDACHNEDVKLVSLLLQCPPHNSNDLLPSCLPLPASSNMYWFSPDQSTNQESGFDIRLARMRVLGYDIYCPQDRSCFTDIPELLTEPVHLAKGDELFNHEFVNILHMLQVVQFYCWKVSKLHTCKCKMESGKVVPLSQSQLERVHALTSYFVKDEGRAAIVFGYARENENGKHCFDWAEFSAAITEWEDYTCKLRREILLSLPHWRTHQSIYSLPSDQIH